MHCQKTQKLATVGASLFANFIEGTVQNYLLPSFAIDHISCSVNLGSDLAAVRTICHIHC
jgi:hypothetical protein